jgi:AraC-like DNA-binding protein
MNLSCSGAPIFGIDGRLLAVLDVSAIDPQRSESAQALTGAVTVNSARAIDERHLGVSIGLATLAGVAGVSIHHFARGFKQSAGVTPHHYLTRKRVERAQDLLARTELSLSEIALAVGFSDQSHLARHFRQMLGVTPGQFRWAQR